MNALTPYPTIDDLRTYNDVLKLASQASQEEWRTGTRVLIQFIEENGLTPPWKPDGRLKAAAEGDDPIVRMYDFITGYFSNSDVDDLRFLLGIPDGELGTGEKRQRVIALIEYCRNHGRLGELLALCRSKRAHLDWPDTI